MYIGDSIWIRMKKKYLDQKVLDLFEYGNFGLDHFLHLRLLFFKKNNSKSLVLKQNFNYKVAYLFVYYKNLK